MNLNLDTGQWVVIGLSAFLFIWYFAANAYSRQRGVAAYRWLYRALEGFGKIQAEWIGASSAGARLVVSKASKPFQRVEAVYLLEPREFLPYWAFSRLRGKRDEVVVKITLRFSPKTTLEVRRDSGHQSPNTSNGTGKSIHLLDGFEMIYDGPEDQRLIDGLKAFLSDQGASVRMITLQREAPHLVIHAKLSPVLHSPAESYLDGLQAWFQDS